MFYVKESPKTSSLQIFFKWSHLNYLFYVFSPKHTEISDISKHKFHEDWVFVLLAAAKTTHGIAGTKQYHFLGNKMSQLYSRRFSYWSTKHIFLRGLITINYKSMDPEINTKSNFTILFKPLTFKKSFDYVHYFTARLSVLYNQQRISKCIMKSLQNSLNIVYGQKKQVFPL